MQVFADVCVLQLSLGDMAIASRLLTLRVHAIVVSSVGLLWLVLWALVKHWAFVDVRDLGIAAINEAFANVDKAMMSFFAVFLVVWFAGSLMVYPLVGQFL